MLMTPKSLLRHKLRSQRRRVHHRIIASTASCGTTRRTATPTPSWSADDKIKRVVMCSGKVYFDLLEERDARGINDVYLLRVEQFYPFPANRVERTERASKTPSGLVSGRAQKPRGLVLHGAQHRMGARRGSKPRHAARYAGRAAAASPATGLASQHKAATSSPRERCADSSKREKPWHRSPRPTLGESVTEATVATWFKKAGDAVAVDEMLCELETDKVTVEVPAPSRAPGPRSSRPKAKPLASTPCLASISEGERRRTEQPAKRPRPRPHRPEAPQPAAARSMSWSRPWAKASPKRPWQLVQASRRYRRRRRNAVRAGNRQGRVEVRPPAADLTEILAAEGATVARSASWRDRLRWRSRAPSRCPGCCKPPQRQGRRRRAFSQEDDGRTRIAAAVHRHRPRWRS